MRKVIIYRFFTISVLFLATAAVETSAQSITGSISDGTVTKGRAAKGTVVLNIPGGLHVNSNRPSSEYAIPTVVRLSPGGGARVSSVSYPRGKNRKFQFSENQINVYEGRVTFPFTVTVPTNFKGQFVRIRAMIRYQACTEEVCYPPKSKEIMLTAKVL